MIVAQIKRDGFPDRYIALEPGVYTVGSDIACDFVFLDPGILSHHVILHVGNGTVNIEAAKGAGVTLTEGSGKRSHKIKPGAKIAWGMREQLVIGECIIELDGLTEESISRPEYSALKGKRPRPLLGCVFSGFLISGLIYPLSAGAPPISSAADHTVPHKNKVLSFGDTDRQTVLASLHARALVPDGLEKSGQKWIATFRVANTPQRGEVMKKLASLAPAVDCQIWVDDELRNAAELALSHLPGALQIASVHQGVIVLREEKKDLQRTEIKRQLLADVPGAADVIFANQPEIALADLSSKIAGVWLGPFPYVVLTNNAVVRPGENLGDEDIKLTHIAPRSLYVEVDGQEREVKLQ
ncbi:hypothetical protein [Brucella intermedia]|uniref:hypothetical protein n=1 Tax=Brucella intermedia TaxID=94625 RepID=UPI00235E0A79|nr:hypothetical protein [Brucella intermedia]